MHRLFFLFLFLSFLNLGYSQTKFEKEFRIKKADVPEQALAFVEAFNFNRKVKWYKEIGINRTSIEAKTKYKRKKYSIEFSPDGVLEDIEIKIKWREIPKETRHTISKYFKSAFKKYRIKKIQVQYLDKDNFLLAQSPQAKATDKPNFNYEIVIAGKVDNTYKKYEYLLTGTGDFLQKAEIVWKNTDNIEY